MEEELIVFVLGLFTVAFGAVGTAAFYQMARYFARKNREETARLQATSEQTVTRSELEAMIRRAVTEGAPIEPADAPRKTLAAREGA